MEVRESQGSLWVRQGWSNATEENVGKSGREKKETKEGEKVAPAKATFRVSQTKNSLFWFTSIGVLRDPSRLKYRLLRSYSTRKPCAKEVPETDFLTERKQYLKRTTLRRLKISLWSICSKEGPHYSLSEAWARKLSKTSDNQPLFMSWKFLLWFHTWAILRSLANARKCQLEDFCEKERYE